MMCVNAERPKHHISYGRSEPTYPASLVLDLGSLLGTQVAVPCLSSSSVTSQTEETMSSAATKRAQVGGTSMEVTVVSQAIGNFKNRWFND